MQAQTGLVYLWLQIIFVKQWGSEKLGNRQPQALAHFVNDPQLHGRIGTVEDIADGRLGNAAFDIELIRRHMLFLEQLRKPFAYCFV